MQLGAFSPPTSLLLRLAGTIPRENLFQPGDQGVQFGLPELVQFEVLHRAKQPSPVLKHGPAGALELL